MADGRKEPKSKYTLDRGMPGAFEGETVTRRRFMTLTAHGAGAVAVSAFALPALGFAAGSALFDRPPVEWEPIGAPEDFPDDTYLPRVITEVAGIGQVGKTTIYVRARNDKIDAAAEPARLRRAVHRALDALHAPRLPGALHRRRQALRVPVPRRRLRLRRAWSTAARRCGRSTASTRASRNGQVEVGARYSVNSEFRRFPSYRDPAQDLDGIGQYLYPGRFSTPKMD